MLFFPLKILYSLAVFSFVEAEMIGDEIVHSQVKKQLSLIVYLGL